MKKLFVASEYEKPSFFVVAFNALLLAVLVVGVVSFSISKVGLTFDFSFLPRFKVRLWDGFLMTIMLSVYSLVVSLFIGTIVAISSNSRIILAKISANIYVKLIRGTPLIMQIYLFYYIIGTAFGISNRVVAGVVILSIFEGAYISEILRGSLRSMDQKQLEVAKSVGFTKLQTLKLVILPQLVARTLPALTGQFASIIKDSSLLSMIAVIELTQTIREISATNLKLFESYLFLGVLYLLLTLPLSFLSEKLEKRFGYGTGT